MRNGTPVAWPHRITGSSILARWLPPAFKNGLDPDAVEGAAKPCPMRFRTSSSTTSAHEPPGLTTGWWRGVGPTHNIFVVESFIDELAAAAKQDPVDYRRACSANRRACSACSISRRRRPAGASRCRAGVGPRRLGAIRLRQLSRRRSPRSRSSKDGEVNVRRVVCAVDCGQVVNPDTIAAQIEGGIIFGISAALWGEITFKNGRVEQSNFNDYRVLRINEAPLIEVHLVKSTRGARAASASPARSASRRP